MQRLHDCPVCNACLCLCTAKQLKTLNISQEFAESDGFGVAFCAMHFAFVATAASWHAYISAIRRAPPLHRAKDAPCEGLPVCMEI